MNKQNRVLRQIGFARLLRVPTVELAKHCGPQEHAASPPAFRQRPIGQTLLFCGLGLFALMFLINGPVPGSPSQGQFYLINLGVVGAFAGLLVPWNRIMDLRLHRPSDRLALLSQMMGWLAGCLLPGSLYGGTWLLTGGLVLALVATILLWQGNSWIVLAWYLAPVVILALVALFLVGSYRPDLVGIEPPHSRNMFGPTLGCLFLTVWTVKLAIETHEYFLQLRKAAQHPNR